MIYDIQKASMLKRIPAWILDAILAIIVATVAMAGLAFLLNLDGHVAALDEIYVSYEQKYGIDFSLSEEEVAQLDEEVVAIYQAAAEELSKDTRAEQAYEKVINTLFAVLSLSLFAPSLLLEFLVPLWLKNGQTLGKKAFGVGVMRTDGVRVNKMILFTRAVLGKYTLETMIPILLLMMVLLGTLGMIGLLALIVALFLIAGTLFVSKNHTAIHDRLACTVAVDLSSQLIFDTPEEREEYIAKADEDADFHSEQ